MHQLNFDQLLTQEPTQPATFSTDRPIIGTLQYKTAQARAHLDQLEEDALAQLGLAQRRANWTIYPEVCGPRWQLKHPLFNVRPNDLLHQLLETAAYISLKYWLHTSAADRQITRQHYPHLLWPEIRPDRIFVYTCKGILLPTLDQFVDIARKEENEKEDKGVNKEERL